MATGVGGSCTACGHWGRGQLHDLCSLGSGAVARGLNIGVGGSCTAIITIFLLPHILPLTFMVYIVINICF